MIRIDHGRLDELSRDRGFGRSKNDTGLLFPFRLGLPRHGVLQGNRDRDVADLDRLHRNAPVGGFASDFAAQQLVCGLRSDNSADSIDDPIISRSEVWATRSMASR